MTVNKNHNGSIIISDIINNQYIHQTYYGYNLKQSKQLFKQHIEQISTNRKEKR